MKTAERVFIGLLGTAVLTTVILFALDAYNAHLKTVQLASLLEAEGSDANDKTGTGYDNTALSVGSRERQMVYQARENTDTSEASIAQQNLPDSKKQASSETAQPDQHADSQSDKQDGQAGAYPDSKKQQDEKDSDKKNSDKKNSDEKNSDKKDSDEKNSKDKKNAENDKAGNKKQDSDGSKRPLKFETVDEDYFSDALFIGDSRTVGMQQSSLLPNAAYYAKTGIGIGNILTRRIVNEGGVMISVQEALRRHSFGKVYIMIGINDISAGDTEWFIEQYEKILEAVRETQPKALIYIQGNIPMSYGTQDLNGALNNKNLSKRNEASRALANGKNIFYLDVDEIFADGNGNLASMYTGDGLHIDKSHYPIWVDYLLHNAIVR